MNLKIKIMNGVRIVFIVATLLSSIIGTCYSSSRSSHYRDFFPVVPTSTGNIRGKQVNIDGKTVTAFLGIPYAEPPVGDQRFKRSVPKQSWSGVYDATKKPPPCMQYSTGDFQWTTNSTPSEDCLYLNVWVPGRMNSCELESKSKPVLLWIYGGGFVLGSSEIDLYDGATLASVGNVIVVSVNYRLGAFGFLTSGTPEAPGNMGMHDQYLAMDWVKNNIKYFKGDPDKITLFGESAGGVSIGLHLISPLSRNLFRRAIIESGGPYHPLIAEDRSVMVGISNVFATTVGCANDTVTIFTDPPKVMDCLRKMDSLRLVTVLDNFRPVHGDDLFPVDPITAMDKGDFKHTQVLIGNNLNEGALLVHFILPGIFGSQHVSQLDKQQAEAAIRGIFQNSTNPPPQVVSEFYLNDVSDTDSSAIIKAVVDSFGDFIISCPSVLFAEKFSKGGEAFYYQFTHRPSNSPWGEWMGVTHFDEVPFVFGDPLRNSSRYTAKEVIFSRTIMKRWGTFARTGVPTVSKTERWPKFTASRPLYVELNPKRRRVGEGPHKKGCDFWRKYFVVPT